MPARLRVLYNRQLIDSEVLHNSANIFITNRSPQLAPRSKSGRSTYSPDEVTVRRRLFSRRQGEDGRACEAFSSPSAPKDQKASRQCCSPPLSHQGNTPQLPLHRQWQGASSLVAAKWLRSLSVTLFVCLFAPRSGSFSFQTCSQAFHLGYSVCETPQLSACGMLWALPMTLCQRALCQ